MLALCPSDLAIRTRYGAFLVDEKRLAEADRQVAQARELDPEALDLTLLRARIAVGRKAREEARDLARRVLAEDPDNPEALQPRDVALRLLSRFAWWQVWLVTYVAFALVRATMPEPVVNIVAVAFLVYSWVLPAILTAWVKRRMR